MSLKGKIASVALTDTGRVREHNEDMIGTEADIGLFVLADGMGGYNAGEVASGIAVKTIINLVRDAVAREDLSVPDPETGLTRPSIILRDAIHRANKIIYHTSKTQPQCEWALRWWRACFTTTRCRSHMSETRGFTGCATTVLSR
jgi:serine/threonine protein phosphatase PrpC